MESHATWIYQTYLMNDSDRYEFWLTTAKQSVIDAALNDMPLTLHEIAVNQIAGWMKDEVETEFANMIEPALATNPHVWRDLLARSIGQIDFAEIAETFVSRATAELVNV